jgi:hypothetical protein
MGVAVDARLEKVEHLLEVQLPVPFGISGEGQVAAVAAHFQCLEFQTFGRACYFLSLFWKTLTTKSLKHEY